MSIKYPVSVMSGAEWNVVDDSGCRIAICGSDTEYEKDGPAIAREIVTALILQKKLKEIVIFKSE